MKAILYPRYGSPDVLRLRDVEKPAPKEGEVLIKVQAASVNSLDWHFMTGKPSLVRITSNGLRKPKDPRLGVDLAGRVEAVGSGVSAFQVGDEVFGMGHGAFAEYACAPATSLVTKPGNVTFESAAAVPIAAVTALEGLRARGHIAAGERVLVNGSSGGVGTFAVQLAKAFGAEVTAVCSTRSVDVARSLGADHVIDYTREDVTRSKQRYDLILGVNGYHSVFAYQRLLRPKGRFVMIGAANARLMRSLFQMMLFGPMLAKLQGNELGSIMASPGKDNLAFVCDLLASGQVVPMVDRCYPLHETADALRYMEEGHPKGKIVITV
jgi:NADPH:quinone reductase-like Zn-dependent oxidoreductase